MTTKPMYFDCNATTPLEPEVIREVMRCMDTVPGNPGNRMHEYGKNAGEAVSRARVLIAGVIGAKADDVIFTSGATESCNLAVFGLQRAGETAGKKHAITSCIEHKAVLEPFLFLANKCGWDVSFLAADESGRFDPGDLKKALRADTFLVSLMHVNNETGVVQPIQKAASLLRNHPCFFHVDATQGFGKDLKTLKNPRLDLISVGAHKIYGPQGIGALIRRKRSFKLPPLEAFQYGGGQEHGLRPGTLAVPLIAGFGKAAELAARDNDLRNRKCLQMRDKVLAFVDSIGGVINGDLTHCLPNAVNISLPGISSEAATIALREFVAISSGSACMSTVNEPSHVLKGMGLDKERRECALRFSWCHMTQEPDWAAMREALGYYK